MARAYPDSSGVPKRIWLYAKKRRSMAERPIASPIHAAPRDGASALGRSRRWSTPHGRRARRAAAHRRGSRTRSGARVRKAAPASSPISSARWRPHSSIRQQNVRIVATRWPVCQTPPRVVDPQDLGREPEEDRQSTGGRRSRATPMRPRSHQHRPTPVAARIALIAEFPLIRADRADDGDQRHEDDRGEWRKRHVVAAVDRDDVVRPELELEPRPAVQERIGEVEEVAAAGIEARSQSQ